MVFTRKPTANATAANSIPLGPNVSKREFESHPPFARPGRYVVESAQRGQDGRRPEQVAPPPPPPPPGTPPPENMLQNMSKKNKNKKKKNKKRKRTDREELASPARRTRARLESPMRDPPEDQRRNKHEVEHAMARPPQATDVNAMPLGPRRKVAVESDPARAAAYPQSTHGPAVHPTVERGRSPERTLTVHIEKDRQYPSQLPEAYTFDIGLTPPTHQRKDTRDSRHRFRSRDRSRHEESSKPMKRRGASPWPKGDFRKDQHGSLNGTPYMPDRLRRDGAADAYGRYCPSPFHLRRDEAATKSLTPRSYDDSPGGPRDHHGTTPVDGRFHAREQVDEYGRTRERSPYRERQPSRGGSYEDPRRYEYDYNKNRERIGHYKESYPRDYGQNRRHERNRSSEKTYRYPSERNDYSDRSDRHEDSYRHPREHDDRRHEDPHRHLYDTYGSHHHHGRYHGSSRHQYERDNQEWHFKGAAGPDQATVEKEKDEFGFGNVMSRKHSGHYVASAVCLSGNDCESKDIVGKGKGNWSATTKHESEDKSAFTKTEGSSYWTKYWAKHGKR